MAAFPGSIDVLTGGFLKALNHLIGFPINGHFNLSVEVEQLEQPGSAKEFQGMKDQPRSLGPFRAKQVDFMAQGQQFLG
jgi:hypothetical protein